MSDFPAPTGSPAQPPRRLLPAVWRWVRSWPTWGQALGWLLAWPVLLALFLVSGSTRSLARSVAAVAVLLIATPAWAGALRSSDPSPPPEAVVAEEASPPAESEAAARVATTAVAEKSRPGKAATDQRASKKPAAKDQDAAPQPKPSKPRRKRPQPVATPAPALDGWQVVHVVDGDTIDVRSAAGVTERVRVIGIDTPERGECGFGPATSLMSKLVLGKRVDLQPGAADDRDRYGRILRYVDVDGTDAGLRLIKRGLAIARYDSRDGYGRHPREDRYVAADAATPHQCRGTSQPVAPAPAPKVQAPAGGVFANCTEARAAGAAPVHRGDPGYGSHLDRDGDGIGCE